MHRKTSYIHAGTSCAGERDVQSALAQNESLLRDADIILPAAGRLAPHAINHGNLVFALMNNPRLDPGLGGLSELKAELEASGDNSIVLSSPLMSAVIRTPKALETLRGLLASQGFHIHWVLYMRTFEDWLQHTYMEQLLAAKTTLDCEEWLQQNPTQPLMDPDALFSPLFHGEDAVSLRSYDATGGEVGADFLSKLGVRDAADHPGQLRDQGPEIPGMKVRFYQLLSRFARLHLDEESRKSLFLKARDAARLLPSGPPFRGILPDTAAKIRKQTQPSHERLLQRAGIDTPFDTFFPPLPPAEDARSDVESEGLLYQSFVHCALG